MDENDLAHDEEVIENVREAKKEGDEADEESQYRYTPKQVHQISDVGTRVIS